MACNWPKVGV